MKCATCGKEIKNAYYLDGKVYGYNCYKLVLTQKYAKMQELKNDDYSRKCIALIEVFKTKTFKDKWNKDFQESILNQFDNGHKLTGKQFNLISNKLDEVEKIEYNFLYLDLSKMIEDNKEYIDDIKNDLHGLLLINSNMLKHFKNDERLFILIKDYYKKLIEKRGYKYYLIESIDEDDKEDGYDSFMEVVKEDRLNKYKEDKYTEILFLKEI